MRLPYVTHSCDDPVCYMRLPYVTHSFTKQTQSESSHERRDTVPHDVPLFEIGSMNLSPPSRMYPAVLHSRRATRAFSAAVFARS